MLEKIYGLYRLWFQVVHDVDHEDCDVAKGRPAIAKVGERLVAGGVDDQEAGQLDLFKLFRDINGVNDTNTDTM